MDPGQDKHQYGDQPEAHKVVLPADGSQVLEGHPDNVSKDKGEESRWTSPPFAVSSTISSSEGLVGNNSTRSSSANGTSISSCSCTSSSSPTVDRSCAVLQLLEVLPPEWKFTCDIRMAQKPQEGISSLISLESTHECDKREEPILRPLDSRHIGTSQPYRVGLEEDAGHVTSVTGRNRRSKKGRDSEEEVPTKKIRHSVGEEDPVLSSHVKMGMTSCAKIFMAYDDFVWSSPVISPSDEDPFLSTVLSSSPLDSILEDPILPPSVFSPSPIPFEHHILLFPAISPTQSLGLEEESGHVTSVTCSKRTKVSEAEEEPLVKKTSHSVAEEDPVLSSPVLLPSCGMDHEDLVWLSPVLSPSQYILDEDPFLMSTVLSPSPLDPIFEDPVLLTCVFSLSPTLPFDDPILSFPVLSPSPSAHGKDSSLSSSDDCILMESEEDKDEEPIQSTSGIGPDRIRKRESFRQPWFRPFYNMSSDSD